MSIVDYIILSIYFIISIIIAFSVKRARSVDEFSMANKSISGILVFASLSATLIGPGYSMGVVNNSYKGGFIWFFIFLAFSIQTLLSGLVLAPKIRKFNNANTIADIMGVKYGKVARLITAIISFVSLIGFFAAISGATGDIVNALIGVDRVLAIFLCVGFVILYSSLGGIKSVVATDTFQFGILAISLPLSFIIMVSSDFQSFSAIEFVPDFNGNISILGFIGLFISFFFGEALIPPYVHRILISKDEINAKKGYIYAGLFSIVWFFICVVAGVYSSEIFNESANPFIEIIKTKLPIGITGLIIAAMISIILSTLSSLLNSATVTLNVDILKQKSNFWKNKDIELKGLMILSVFIGLISIFFAIQSPNIIDGLLVVYSLWGASIVIPFALAILLKNTYPAAGVSAILAGIIVSITWKWILNTPNGIEPIVPGLFVNIIVYLLIHLTLKNKK